jgi:hypothetical protein
MMGTATRFGLEANFARLEQSGSKLGHSKETRESIQSQRIDCRLREIWTADQLSKEHREKLLSLIVDAAGRHDPNYHVQQNDIEDFLHLVFWNGWTTLRENLEPSSKYLYGGKYGKQPKMVNAVAFAALTPQNTAPEAASLFGGVDHQADTPELTNPFMIRLLQASAQQTDPSLAAVKHQNGVPKTASSTPVFNHGANTLETTPLSPILDSINVAVAEETPTRKGKRKGKGKARDEDDLTASSALRKRKAQDDGDAKLASTPRKRVMVQSPPPMTEQTVQESLFTQPHVTPHFVQESPFNPSHMTPQPTQEYPVVHPLYVAPSDVQLAVGGTDGVSPSRRSLESVPPEDIVYVRANYKTKAPNEPGHVEFTILDAYGHPIGNRAFDFVEEYDADSAYLMALHDYDLFQWHLVSGFNLAYTIYLARCRIVRWALNGTFKYDAHTCLHRLEGGFDLEDEHGQEDGAKFRELQILQRYEYTMWPEARNALNVYKEQARPPHFLRAGPFQFVFNEQPVASDDHLVINHDNQSVITNGDQPTFVDGDQSVITIGDQQAVVTHEDESLNHVVEE